MSATRTLDISEFLQVLHAEVETGIRSGLSGREQGPLLRITQVRVRFGVNPVPGTDLEDQAPAVADPILPESEPWEFEVVLDPYMPGGRLEITETELGRFRVYGADREEVATPLDYLPVAAVQGVGPNQASLLAQHGIETLAQLARMDDVARLGPGWHRHLEFRTKARLARSPAPLLLPSRADSLPLYRLIGMSPEELFHLIGSKAITLSRCRHLSVYLDLLSVAIDDRQLKRIPLKRLVLDR